MASDAVALGAAIAGDAVRNGIVRSSMAHSEGEPLRRLPAKEKRAAEGTAAWAERRRSVEQDGTLRRPSESSRHPHVGHATVAATSGTWDECSAVGADTESMSTAEQRREARRQLGVPIPQRPRRKLPSRLGEAGGVQRSRGRSTRVRRPKTASPRLHKATDAKTRGHAVLARNDLPAHLRQQYDDLLLAAGLAARRPSPYKAPAVPQKPWWLREDKEQVAYPPSRSPPVRTAMPKRPDSAVSLESRPSSARRRRARRQQRRRARSPRQSPRPSHRSPRTKRGGRVGDQAARRRKRRQDTADHAFEQLARPFSRRAPTRSAAAGAAAVASPVDGTLHSRRPGPQRQQSYPCGEVDVPEDTAGQSAVRTKQPAQDRGEVMTPTDASPAPTSPNSDASSSSHSYYDDSNSEESWKSGPQSDCSSGGVKLIAPRKSDQLTPSRSTSGSANGRSATSETTTGADGTSSHSCGEEDPVAAVVSPLMRRRPQSAPPARPRVAVPDAAHGRSAPSTNDESSTSSGEELGSSRVEAVDPVQALIAKVRTPGEAPSQPPKSSACSGDRPPSSASPQRRKSALPVRRRARQSRVRSPRPCTDGLRNASVVYSQTKAVANPRLLKAAWAHAPPISPKLRHGGRPSAAEQRALVERLHGGHLRSQAASSRKSTARPATAGGIPAASKKQRPRKSAGAHQRIVCGTGTSAAASCAKTNGTVTAEPTQRTSERKVRKRPESAPVTARQNKRSAAVANTGGSPRVSDDDEGSAGGTEGSPVYFYVQRSSGEQHKYLQRALRDRGWRPTTIAGRGSQQRHGSLPLRIAASMKSGLLKRAKLIWTIGEGVDYDLLQDGVYHNHFRGIGALTTKAGLMYSLRGLHHYAAVDAREFFPRCFCADLDADDRVAFVEEYRLTAATCVVKRWACWARCGHFGNSATPPLPSAARTVPAKFADELRLADTWSCRCSCAWPVRAGLLRAAMSVCKLLLQTLRGEWPDIDRKRTRRGARAAQTAAEEGAVLPRQLHGWEGDAVAAYVEEMHSAAEAIAVHERDPCTCTSTSPSSEGPGCGPVPPPTDYQEWAHLAAWSEATKPMPVTGADVRMAVELDDALCAVLPNWRSDGVNNVWALKPRSSSRGQGVELHWSLPDMLERARQGRVLQKYIERPLLLGGFKFDIRVFALIESVSPLRVWTFGEPYLRRAAKRYSLHPSAMNGGLSNAQAHLCNFAIQRAGNVRSDGKPALLSRDGSDATIASGDELDLDLDVDDPTAGGQVWSMARFIHHLQGVLPPGSYDDAGIDGADGTCMPASENHGRAIDLWNNSIMRRMRHAIVNAVIASQESLQPRKGSFELVAADFVLAEDNFTPWLLEVNLSPALNHRTPFLRQLLARMVKSALDITIGPVQADCDEESRDSDVVHNVGDWELAYDSGASVPPPKSLGVLHHSTPGALAIIGRALKRSELRACSTADAEASRRDRAASVLQLAGRRFVVSSARQRHTARQAAARTIQELFRGQMQRGSSCASHRRGKRRDEAAASIQRFVRRAERASTASVADVSRVPACVDSPTGCPERGGRSPALTNTSAKFRTVASSARGDAGQDVSCSAE